MDFEQARQDVIHWLENFVERSDGQLAELHLGQAYTKNLLDVRLGITDPYTDLRTLELGRFNLIVFVYEPTEFEVDEFYHQIGAVNDGFLKPRGLQAFAWYQSPSQTTNSFSIKLTKYFLAFVQPYEIAKNSVGQC